MTINFNPDTEQGREQIEREYQRVFGRKNNVYKPISTGKMVALYSLIGTLIAAAVAIFIS